jgi:hypothetical protein
MNKCRGEGGYPASVSFGIASAYAPRVKYVQILLLSTSFCQASRCVKECHVTLFGATNFANQYMLPKEIKECEKVTIVVGVYPPKCKRPEPKLTNATLLNTKTSPSLPP